MDDVQLKAWRDQYETDAAAIEKEITAAESSGDAAAFKALEAKVERLTVDRARLESAEKSARNTAWLAKMGDGAGGGGTVAADGPVNVDAVKMGREVSPLGFSQPALKSLHKAISSRQGLSVKAFSTLDSLLPAQLAPGILGKIHESRLLDRLPAQPISAPSYEILVHSSTTGAPATVAEGAAKPEVTPVMTSQTIVAQKIAAHTGLGYESMMDFPGFQSYAQTELMRQIEDVENAQLLSGNGTGTNLTGFLSTSGILTHDASTDTGTNVTVIDSIEKSITALRVGSALAVADLLVLNPSTWSAIRRLKDTVGRFLFISSDSDPTQAEANAIFNVPVLVTTAMTAGTGLMLDTTKFGRVLIREGITVHTGTNLDDFTKNIVRFVIEERLGLAVERPSAVLAISNLPTS